MSEAADIQRTLGRIEGGLKSLTTDVRAFRELFDSHQKADLFNLDIIGKSISKQREDTLAIVATQKDELTAALQRQDETRNLRFDEQDKKLDAMKQDQDRAKGAGWVIIGLLGVFATFIGGAVIAVIGQFVKLH